MIPSPRQAVAANPGLVLPPKESAAIEKARSQFMTHLSGPWEGAAVTMGVILTAKALAALIRELETPAVDGSRWSVAAQAIDGEIAKAADLIKRGMPCQFMVTISPVWSTR